MDAAARAPRITRRAWVYAGALLIAAQLPVLAGGLFAGSVVFAIIGEVCMAAALCVVAFGRDSVVARRPLGVVALVGTGVWPLLERVVGSAVPALWGDPVQTGVGLGVSVAVALLTVQAMFALVAVVQVWRAGIVPAPLRWAPVAALAACALPYLVSYLPLTAVPPGEPLVGVFTVIGMLRTAAMIGLGVLCVVAGVQPRPADASTVVVYRSPER